MRERAREEAITKRKKKKKVVAIRTETHTHTNTVFEVRTLGERTFAHSHCVSHKTCESLCNRVTMQTSADDVILDDKNINTLASRSFHTHSLAYATYNISCAGCWMVKVMLTLISLLVTVASYEYVCVFFVGVVAVVVVVLGAIDVVALDVVVVVVVPDEASRLARKWHSLLARNGAIIEQLAKLLLFAASQPNQPTTQQILNNCAQRSTTACNIHKHIDARRSLQVRNSQRKVRNSNCSVNLLHCLANTLLFFYRYSQHQSVDISYRVNVSCKCA